MEKSIKDIEKELVALEKQKAELENKLSNVMEQAMLHVVKMQKINRISDHIIVVKSSDMIGNPWNPHFYDWKQALLIVKKFLRNKPVYQWKTALQQKLNETKSGAPVVFVFSHSSNWYGTIQERIPVSYQFIQEIIKQLDK